MLTYVWLLLCFGDIDFKKPVPASDWAVVQAPEKGIYDAVILQDTTTIFETAIERYRRVRILSEAGKLAAEFADETGSAKKIEGRVVYADGRELVFDQKSDLEEVLLSKHRGDTNKVRLLIPPGLAKDCVVEMSWTLPASRGLPLNVNEYYVAVSEPWLVQEKSFTFVTIKQPPNMRFLVRQVWSRSNDEHFKEKKGAGRQTVSYLNIPAQDEVPFGNDYRRDTGHYIHEYLYFSDLGSKPETYWKDVADKYIRAEVFQQQFKPDGSYDLWVKELKANLPAGAVPAMKFLQDAFRQRLANTRMLHPSQIEKVKRETEDDDVPEKILGNVWKRGYGNSYELMHIFFHLVTDVGLRFSLVYPTQIDEKPFDPRSLSAFAFNYQYPLFAVFQGERPVLFVPYSPEYGPGFAPTDYEGLPAMVVTPEDQWSQSFINLPTTGAESNRMVTQSKTEIHADFSYELSFKRQVTGAYLSQYLRYYYPMPTEEKNAALALEWKKSNSCQLIEAVVEGADDLNSVVTERVSGRSSSSLEKLAVFVFDPFPGAYRMLSTPNNWPENRDQELYLPFNRQHIDLNVITVPEGWKLRGENSWQRSNVLGEIKFQASQEGNKVTVRRDTTLAHNRLDRRAEPLLKAFLAWMDEAYNQSIAFDVSGGQE